MIGGVYPESPEDLERLDSRDYYVWCDEDAEDGLPWVARLVRQLLSGREGAPDGR